MPELITMAIFQLILMNTMGFFFPESGYYLEYNWYIIRCLFVFQCQREVSCNFCLSAELLPVHYLLCHEELRTSVAYIFV